MCNLFCIFYSLALLLINFTKVTLQAVCRFFCWQFVVYCTYYYLNVLHTKLSARFALPALLLRPEWVPLSTPLAGTPPPPQGAAGCGPVTARGLRAPRFTATPWVGTPVDPLRGYPDRPTGLRSCAGTPTRSLEPFSALLD